jgi:hypothetical protein
VDLTADVEVHDQIVQFGDADSALAMCMGSFGAYYKTLTGQNISRSQGLRWIRVRIEARRRRQASFGAPVSDGPFIVIVFLFTPGAFDRATRSRC